MTTAPTGIAPTRTPLKDLAATGMTMGNLLEPWLFSDDRYRDILDREFNFVEIVQFNDRNIWWTGRREYDWAYLDNLAAWPHRMGWQARAMIVWGVDNRLPSWLLEGSFSRAEYISILQEFISDVVGRYKGLIDEWSIANEAVSRSLGSPDFWTRKIGLEYIDIAFHAARSADPTGVLALNDDSNHEASDAKSSTLIESLYSRVKSMKSSGVPIDAVGMQMHLLLPWNSQSPPNKDRIIATMRRFAELGVQILVTELDVSIRPLSGDLENKLKQQADIYSTVATASIESGVCTNFTVFGVSDTDSWITHPNGGVGISDAEPLLWDRQYRPKPAYDAVWRAFAGS